MGRFHFGSSDSDWEGTELGLENISHYEVRNAYLFRIYKVVFYPLGMDFNGSIPSTTPDENSNGNYFL